ncbi:hypothetical protein PINS_up014635 [Pythium insidiosum]|nr:hypothetical protein PINS_up014635 [Pythium insidiosum]
MAHAPSHEGVVTTTEAAITPAGGHGDLSLTRPAVLSVRVPPLRSLPPTESAAPSSSSSNATTSNSSNNNGSSQSTHNSRSSVKSRQQATRASRQRQRVKRVVDETLDGWGDFDSDRLLRDDNNGDEDEYDDDASHAGAAFHGSDATAFLVRDGDDDELYGDDKHGGSNQRRVEDVDDAEQLSESRRAPARVRTASTVVSVSRPPTQLQPRQRTLAVTDLEPSTIDAVRQQQEHALYPSVLPRRSVLRKPMLAHRAPKKKYAARHGSENDSDGAETSFLPRLGRGVAQPGATATASATAAAAGGAVLSPRSSGLFGSHVPDTLETRATVFAHLELLWSLLSSRSNASQSATTSPRNAEQSPPSTLALRRSTFECSLVLMKLCKTLGIALPASAVPVSWSGSDKDGVAFEPFCDFVIRNAVQPAMQHFKLDRNLRDYLVTLDRILESLVTTDPPSPPLPNDTASVAAPLRMRELQEIRPVLPYWKKGISSLQRQAPLLSSGTGTSAGMDHHHNVKPRPQPAQEARTLQDANIRLKLRLRRSWDPSRSIVAEQQPQQTAAAAARGSAGGGLQGVSGSSLSLPAASSPSKDIAPDRDDLALDSTSSPAVAPPSSSKPHSTTTAEPSLSSSLTTPPKETETEREMQDLELVCCHCQQDAASLWCSSCFAVYCGTCWTRVHHSVVDTSGLDQRHELVKTLTARPLARLAGDDDMAPPPPVDVVYLPTKALIGGRRTGLRCQRSIPERPEYEDEDAEEQDRDGSRPVASDHELLAAVQATSLLPLLRERQSTHHRSAAAKSMRHSQSASVIETTSQSSAMDSTANLVKALMLGTASSASVLGSTSSSSPSSLGSLTSGSSQSKRTVKDSERRQRLAVAAVTLDATRLLS